MKKESDFMKEIKDLYHQTVYKEQTVMVTGETTRSVEFAVKDSIDGIILVFKVSKNDYSLFGTKDLDGCFSLIYFVEKWAKFLKALDNKRKEVLYNHGL